MTTTKILFLQSTLITLQMINGGLSGIVHNPLITLVFAAVVGGFQYFVQSLGNNTAPPKKDANKAA